MTEVVEARVLHRPAAGHAWLPEGPRALGSGRLLWVTIQCGASAQHGALHVLATGRGENRSWPLPGRPGFAFPTTRETVYLVGMERAVGLYDTAERRFGELVGGLDAHVDGTIVNDGALLPQGLVFGAKDTTFREHKAGLWFLRAADRRLFPLRRDMLCSNGVVGRPLPGGRVELFHIDSPTRVVRRFELDPDAGALTGDAIAIDLRHERAVPDGMVLVPGRDEVVIALFDPGPEATPYGRALQCSLRDGRVVREYRTPGAMQVTCPAWLDTQHGSHLVLTTAAERLLPEQLRAQPNAGCLFAAAVPGVTVPATPRWPA